MSGKHAKTLIYFYPEKFAKMCLETGLKTETLVEESKISKRALLAYKKKKDRGCQRDTFLLLAEYFGWEKIFPAIKKGEVIAIGLYERQRRLNPDLPPLKVILEKAEPTHQLKTHAKETLEKESTADIISENKEEEFDSQDSEEHKIEPEEIEAETNSHCPNCSSETDESMKYCFKCGHNLKPLEHNMPATIYTIETDRGYDALKKAYRNYIKRHGGTSFSGGIIPELEELETIPSEAIINRFCMEAYSYFRKLEDPELFGGSGCFINHLLKKYIQKNNRISISFKGRPDHIGKKFDTGLLEINGDVGWGIGTRMSNGEIRLNGDASGILGYKMTGGKILVDGNTGDGTGERITGNGTIIVNGNVGDDLGIHMEGNLIEVYGNAKENVGRGMKGGTIKIAGNAGDQLGIIMEGGEIVIGGDVTGTVGRQMKDGAIIIEGNVILGKCSYFSTIGEHMVGGLILIKGDIVNNGKRNDLVGYGIEGGDLVIEGDLHNASLCNTHGNIYHNSITRKKPDLLDKILRLFDKF